MAGIIFAVLLGTSLVLIRSTVPADLDDISSWQPISADRQRLLVALHLVPFAGIAFLWFLGVVRDRIGDAEDRFIATVFLGSGLLLIAMLFVSTAVAGSILVSGETASPDGATWAMGRHLSSSILTVYAMRMAECS